MTENQTTAEVSNAFTRMLQELNKGATVGDLSEAMQACVAHSRETGKTSEIKYTIKFTPAGEAMAVTDKIETKLPKEDRKVSTFFPTEENTLVRNNPAQQDLALREVPKPPTELKEPIKLQAAATN